MNKPIDFPVDDDWHVRLSDLPAKSQNTGPLIYILLNHNSFNCIVLHSSKGFDTCKTDSSKWPCILLLT